MQILAQGYLEELNSHSHWHFLRDSCTIAEVSIMQEHVGNLDEALVCVNLYVQGGSDSPCILPHVPQVSISPL